MKQIPENLLKHIQNPVTKIEKEEGGLRITDLKTGESTFIPDPPTEPRFPKRKFIFWGGEDII